MATDPIPARLREAREYLGFSLDQAAAALRCSPALITALEDGTAGPAPGMLEKFGRLYRRPLEWFRGESRFEPSPGILRMLEGVKDPGDREGLLDFAEWLQGAGPMPPRPRKDVTAELAKEAGGGN